jgi:ABC-type sugar transport system substrate-binding protein
MKRFLILIAALLLIGSLALAKVQKTLPAGPTFTSSVVAPSDEGKVKPVKKATKTIRIVILCLDNHWFWLQVKQGALDAIKELKAYNCQADFIAPGQTNSTDVFGDAIDAAIAQKYDAIATVAGDAGIVNYIKRANDAGIPVATFNTETATPNPRLFFVGADLYKQGEAAAEAYAKVVGGKGKCALITGSFAVEGHELRRKGFEDVIAKKYPDIKIVGRTETQDKDELGFSQANDFMTANPDLAGIYVTAGGSVGVARAIEESGKKGKVKMVCYDFGDEIMQYVEKGVIDGTIGQDPYAQGHDPAIRLYNYLVAGVVPPAGKLLTRSDFVTKDNLYNFWLGHKKASK